MNTAQLKGIRSMATVLDLAAAVRYAVIDLETKRVFAIDLPRETAEDWLGFFPGASVLTMAELKALL